MPNAILRKWSVVAATAFALVVPAAQALTSWGLSAERFSAAGDQTLRAAGYAFSIWGLIYAGLAAYAIYQLRARAAWLAAVAPWTTIAITGCGLWIIASAANARWATVAVIIASAACALAALRHAPKIGSGVAERMLALWPLALLGGWLLIASALNILTVLTAERLLQPPALPAAAAAVGAVAAIALSALRLGMSAVYPLPAAWGLAAVFLAEQARNPAAAYLALAASAVLIAAAFTTGLRRARRSRAPSPVGA